MSAKIRSDDYRIKPDAKVDLDQWPTSVKPLYGSRQQYQSLLDEHVAQLSHLQGLLYACDRHALLLIFQGMDAAGKDSAIKHVMSGVNPQGCQVYSFKQPSAEEQMHDFLWRTTCRLPERGHIGIFNRSYYEEVLVVRVHPQMLPAEHLAEKLAGSKHFWHQRYRSINDLEHHLRLNGTRILKFFLHVSAEEQRQRLLARIDDPHKNWKFSLADVRERRLWDRYMRCYERCLGATSTDAAPWYAVPADDKQNARLIISTIIRDTLQGLEMQLPRVGAARRRELQKLRALLAR